jgi:hypothetical protein
VKMRDQRIPRMADLTMRPFISGKKKHRELSKHTPMVYVSHQRSTKLLTSCTATLNTVYFSRARTKSWCSFTST